MTDQAKPKSAQPDLLVDFTIMVPVATGGEKGCVNFRDPPTGTSEDENFVCEVSGRVIRQDCDLAGIWVWNTTAPSSLTGSQLAQKIRNEGKECTDITPEGDWFFDKDSENHIPGYLGDNFSDRTNYLYAVAVFESTSGCEAPPDGLIRTREWVATGIQGCPNKARRASAKGTSHSA